MTVSQIINGLDLDEWVIPEVFIETNKEFLQGFLNDSVVQIKNNESDISIK